MRRPALDLVVLEQTAADARLLDALADEQEQGLPHQRLDLVLLE
jgi:hypothetical protein